MDSKIICAGGRSACWRPRLLVVTVLLAAVLTTIGLPGVAHAQHHPRHAPRRRATRHRRARHRRPASEVRFRPLCPGENSHIAHASRSKLKRAVVCLLVHERRLHGLPAVRGSSELDLSAQRWTNVMVARHQFTHGENLTGRISATGFAWSSVGENIATGFRTPMGAVRAWMRSTGHCENILDPRFREVGTGIDPQAAATGSRRGTWTLDLGLRKRQRPGSRDWQPAEGCPYRQ